MKSLILIFLAVFAATKSFAEISFTEFINVYLEESIDVSISNNQVEQAQEQVFQSKGIDRLSLSLDPKIIKNLDGTKSESQEINTQLTQDLVTGSQLSLSLSKSRERDEFGNDVAQQNIAAKYIQPLGQNRFGQLNDLRQEESKANLDLAQSEAKVSNLEQCIAAAEQYSILFLQKKRLDIIERLYHESEKVKSYTESNHNQQLVDDITLLSAQANEIKNRSLLLNEKNTYQRSLAKVSALLKKPDISINQDPEPFLGEINLKSELNTPSLKEVAAAAKIQTLSKSKRVFDEESKSNIDVSLEIGKNDYEKVFIAPGPNKYIQAGIAITIPVKDKSRFYQNRVLGLKIAQSELDLRSLQQDKSIVLQDHKISADSLRKQLELSKKTIDLYEKQNIEGYKQYQKGKIDFETYLVFQNRLLNELLNHLDLKGSLWKLNLSVITWAKEYPIFCGEG